MIGGYYDSFPFHSMIGHYLPFHYRINQVFGLQMYFEAERQRSKLQFFRLKERETETQTYVEKDL